MVFDEVATLITQTYTVNTVGDSIPTETTHDVFVTFRSIGMKRKIEALATGLNVEFKLILSDIAEYNDEKYIVYKNVRYNIKDVYIADDQSVELTVGKN